MTGYRYLPPAEEEMTEAAKFMKMQPMALVMNSLMMYKELSIDFVTILNWAR